MTYGERPEDYLTDVINHKSVDFIQRHASDTSPFFLYVAPYSPHFPATPALRHINDFPNAQAPRLPSFNEADVSDKPEPVRSLRLLDDVDIQAIDDYYRLRLQASAGVDDLIGDVIQALQAAGKLDNTYVFYSSDNGYKLGEHRIPFGQYTAYEEDIHLPLMVRGPGIAANTTRNHFVGTIDLAPTFATLGGAQIPSFVDGRSFVPLFDANPPPATAWRQSFLIEQYPYNGEGDTEPPDPGVTPTLPLVFNGLRTRRFKYVEYIGNSPPRLPTLLTFLYFP